MPSTKRMTLLAAVVLMCVPLLASAQDEGAELTVADQVRIAGQIKSTQLKALQAESESQKLIQENEVVRQRLESRKLTDQLETSLGEIEALKSELARYKRLLKEDATTAQPAARTVNVSTPSAPPLNLRVLNILRGQGISTRARVLVLADNGSARGEFQVKEGSAIQGWTVEAINQNSIQVSKGGDTYTYGQDGMM